MERESFEDEEVAALLNKYYISIKVDREERPDIDSIYMTICQALTGHGGWPLTVIMTPDKKPFFAGTYFPKRGRGQMTGLMDILEKVHDLWENNRSTLLQSSEQITESVQRSVQYKQKEMIGESEIHKGYESFVSSFDEKYGGFGSAPKFPTPHNLLFLLRYWKMTGDEKALNMVEKTLEAMHAGGIYDHIGFGFSRYSTDRKWLAPHFEKMLYDNALLAFCYLEAYQATGKQIYARVVREIFTYVLRDMTSQEGGFFSAEDADSEGVEGKFYVWTVDEIKELLGPQAGEKFCEMYDITPRGNFEGKNIPNLIDASQELRQESGYFENDRQKIFDFREKRIHPYKDDKILTAWNGLMAAAMAVGGRVLGEDTYTTAAENALQFIFKELQRKDGRLLARYREGEQAYLAYVDDYAFIIWALLELYETTFNVTYLKKALALNDDMLQYFWDEENGGLFFYGNDSEQLITRPKEIYDGAIPSGNSVATLNWLRLARLTGKQELEEKAQEQFNGFGGQVKQYPAGYTYFLMAHLFANMPTNEIVIAGNLANDDTQQMIQLIHQSYLPYTVTLVHGEEDDLEDVVPFVKNQRPLEGKATAYVCQNFACQAPITTLNELQALLED